MEALCARLKKLAVQLEGLSAGAASSETRGMLDRGLLALMELKSVFRTVCLATEEVFPTCVLHWGGHGHSLPARWQGCSRVPPFAGAAQDRGSQGVAGSGAAGPAKHLVREELLSHGDARHPGLSVRPLPAQ